jgi:hypothetical protein
MDKALISAIETKLRIRQDNRIETEIVPWK